MSWPAELGPRLEGRIVVLEPLGAQHKEGLRAAAADPELWRWMAIDASTDKGFERWWSDARAQQAAEAEVPFVTILRETGTVIGSTRFVALRPRDRGFEIGGTWLMQAAWNTGANKDAKLLQLEHAFERLGCIRVEFKTDARNERSRRALEALPAQFEGIFRKHMVRWYGFRDSAYYSVVDDEWPDVKRALEAAVGQAKSGSRSASS
jgi:RimJ/RimL family protein N-acetyltransferase